MAIKIFLLIILVCGNAWAQRSTDLLNVINQKYAKDDLRLRKAMEADEVDPEKFSTDFKKAYYDLYQQQAEEILSNDEIPDGGTLKDFDTTKENLEALEFEEDSVEKTDTKVKEYVKGLRNAVYHRSVFAFVDYVSWQQHATLSSPQGTKNLVINNNGWCGGGGYGYANEKYHFFADACLLYGQGDVSAQNTTITYHQTGVVDWGAKGSLGAGMFVSAVKAELGLKIPFLYYPQSFAQPGQNGFKVNDPDDFTTFASVYGKWPFQKWFFQTEFGKMLGRDMTLWSLGAGYKF